MGSNTFNTWKVEKATTALISEAQDLADRLAAAKPHVLDSHAAAAQFWAVWHLSQGMNLSELPHWKRDAITRFVSATSTKIAALRKKREYDSSDGLTIWLHTARAVTEPRIAPAVRQIWRLLLAAGTNADVMAADLMQEAGLPIDPVRHAPLGFGVEE